MSDHPKIVNAELDGTYRLTDDATIATLEDIEGLPVCVVAAVSWPAVELAVGGTHALLTAAQAFRVAAALLLAAEAVKPYEEEATP